jgi:protease I
MSRKILLITGDAGEAYEVLYARHRFLEAGYEPRIAAPSKRRLHLVMHDFAEGWDTYVERPGYELTSDLTFAEVDAKDFAAALVLGGRAPEYLRHDACVIELVQQLHRADKWIFSICHGIQVLITAGLVQGVRATCYEHVRCELEAAGGTFVEQEAVRDGRIVSAQTWQSHPEFYRLVFECLEGK